MASIVVAGDTSGTVTLAAPSVAGTTTLTLPTTSGTLITTGGGAAGSFTTLTSTQGASFATSSGNVGIGTSSPVTKLQISGAESNTDVASTGQTYIQSTTAYNSSPKAGIQFGVKYNSSNAYIYGTSIQGIKDNTTDNNYSQSMIFTTVANGGSPAERMRIDSSGNVGIGTSSPVGDVTRYLNIAGSGGAGIFLHDSNQGVTASDGTTLQAAGVNSYLYNREAGFIAFGTSNTERMRIDTSGNVLVGTTSLWSSGSAGAVNIGGAAGAYTRQTNFYFCNRYSTSAGLPTYIGNWNSNAVFAIGSHSGTNDNIVRIGQAATDSNGAYWNGTYCAVYAGAYTNASDYRIKKNVINYPNGALTQIINLRPVKYNIIANPNEDGNVIKNKTEIGFIAHEIQDVIPEVVVGEKDAIDGNGDELHQGLDYAKLTTVLVKAIQEQQTIIETLKTDIAELKAKVNQ